MATLARPTVGGAAQRIARAVAPGATALRASRATAPGATNLRVARRFASGLPPLGVLKLRDRLDAAVIGQGPLKECLVLALLAKEHVYVEGPPGAAKTLLAETAAAQAQLTTFFCQLHRDTRLSELVGDAVIMREAAPSGGELIRSEVLAGGLLTADVAVLDDISRAPGEALNVLLRLLNERRWHARPIPLLTAIATGNPTGAEFYNEPLDPATLDRFAFQLRCDGLLGAGEWDDAAAVIDRFSSDAAAAAAPAAASTADERALSGAELAELQEAVDRVRLTPEIRDALLAFVSRLAQRHRLDASNALLTDRTFLVKAPKLLRAAAVAAGRDQCEPSDLDVLKYLTAFRVPEEVHAAHVQPIIDEVAEEARREREKAAADGGGGGGEGDGPPGGAGGGGEGTAAGGAGADDGNKPQQSTGGSGAQAPQLFQSAPPERSPSQQRAPDQQQLEEEEDAPQGPPSLIMRAMGMLADLLPKRKAPPPPMNLDAESVEGLNLLLAALEGQFERSNVSRASHADGIPRGWRRLRSFDGFADDADGAEAAAWCERPAAGTLPRAVDRSKPRRGGALAILRDVSTSMHGLNAKYASSLALRVIELARRRKMRVGMLEYSDAVTKLQPGDGFFSRDYNKLQSFARRLECGGLTDYEASIGGALMEFQSDRRLRCRHTPKHILFLTDGAPTKGDRKCVDVRNLAALAGVRIHTLFVQTEDADAYPSVLDSLAADTSGSRMQARVLDQQRGHIDLTVLSDEGDARRSDGRFGRGWQQKAREVHAQDHFF